MVQFALDPSFGFNCTAAFDFSELPHAAPLASLCAQHTATSLALGKGLFDFCSYKEGLCNLHAEKWSGAVHVLRRLRRNLLRVTRAAQRHLGARTAVARRLREEVAESGRRAWRWSQCDELMYLTGGELFTHVPVGNLVGCMKRFRESSFASVMQLFHFALWQLPELQDLRPRWIFDRQMMGGENGDGAVSAEGKVSHSYRSFLLVRLLQQLSEAKRHGLVAAELGVMGAHTSEILMQELPELQMILVEPNIVAEARQRVKPFQHRARWLEAMSDVAHQELPDASLDLVFIDGDHRYQTVVDDLRLWSPKVAPGGCLAGHDFGLNGLGVIRAVSEFALRHNATIRVQTDCFWFFRAADGRLIRTLGSFSTFGERELLNQLPRSFSVTCKSESAMLMAIEKMVFEHVVKERVFAQLQDQLQLRRMDIEMADLHEISTLGYGTFGIVRLVEHHPSGARYALKCISRTEAVARRQQTSICTEREILTDVDHPFILKLVQTFKDRRNVYFLTEFVTGGELFGAIRSLGILNGSQARFYTGSLILALQALHEKMIIYRDLKPGNVLLDNYGYIKLIDFGCAARLNKGGHRSLVGTPHYMAPEVILGKEYNCSCDVWSLGVCLYEFVCGPLPFGQDLEDPKQVFQEILLAKVSFPEHFTNLTGKHLLRSLLRKNSQLRIGGVNGLQDVREHEYFRKFSFARLLGRNLEPPLVSSPPGTPRKDEGAIPQDPSESEPLEAREISESEDWAAEF